MKRYIDSGDVSKSKYSPHRELILCMRNEGISMLDIAGHFQETEQVKSPTEKGVASFCHKNFVDTLGGKAPTPLRVHEGIIKRMHDEGRSPTEICKYLNRYKGVSVKRNSIVSFITRNGFRSKADESRELSASLLAAKWTADGLRGIAA